MKAARSSPDVCSTPRRKVDLTGLYPVWPDISESSVVSACRCGGGRRRHNGVSSGQSGTLTLREVSAGGLALGIPHCEGFRQ
jgi:hypothetical protein